MKIKSVFFIVYFIFLPITITGYSPSLLGSTTNYSNPFTSSPDFGVSNYNITQSVKYQVEINFTLTHKSISSRSYWLQFSRLNDRMPNSTLTQYSAPYQESELLYSSINGISAPSYLLRDEFNNTYDLFNNTLNYNEQITLDQLYDITLNEVSFNDINEMDIGTYNLSDNIFDLYCNRSELYYERNNPTLISASNNIVGSSVSPIEKAEKIYNWIADNITYNGALPELEKGALWAYNNKQGDCSEFSSLMVTLLRIRNIPARKVMGFCISNNPATRPVMGKEWIFIRSKTGETSSTNFLGHAWVEYYVPNIGWIACDPTWHETSYEYFNRIDYLRLNLNIGQWLSIPLLPDVSEFPHPCIVYQEDLFDYSYQVKIIVIESNLAPLTEFPLLFLVFVGIGVTAVLLTLIILIKKSGKKNFYD
jgi:transglutaminase-like putative cysteine protease